MYKHEAQIDTLQWKAEVMTHQWCHLRFCWDDHVTSSKVLVILIFTGMRQWWYLAMSRSQLWVGRDDQVLVSNPFTFYFFDLVYSLVTRGS